ncbi:hypothetical protein BZK32_18290 [Escherichia coli]|nr:hypothetical protein BZK32_18290 [Escherichia coli]
MFLFFRFQSLSLSLRDSNLLIVFYVQIMPDDFVMQWICPYISRHLLSLNPLLARCRRYSRGER